MATFTVNYSDDVGLPRVSHPITVQDSADPALPVVILLRAEGALGAPFVPVHTFGGTSTLLSRARAELFTVGSAIPQVTSFLPPRIQFHWRTAPEALPSPAGGISQLAALAPELENTVGDLLVSDARAQLAGAVGHRTNPINHAEALWDTVLQGQAIDVLRAEA